MKNKIVSSLFIAFLLVLCPHHLSACCGNFLSHEWGHELRDFDAEFRVAYFSPNQKKLRRIYSTGWVDYQLELSYRLCDNWRIWAGVNGFSRRGESIGFHNVTRLTVVPVNVGVRYLFDLGCYTKLYLGVAGCYSTLNIRDHSHFVRGHTRKRQWGALYEIGLYYDLTDCYYMSLFADYYDQRFHIRRSHDHEDYFVKKHSLDMSGYKIGFGWGAHF